MATAGRGQKTAFIRDLYDKNKQLSFDEANSAWKAAGNEGDLSRNTFANLKTAFRKEAGGSGEQGTSAPKPKAKQKKTAKAKTTARPAAATTNEQGAAPTPAPRTQGRERVLVEAEEDIDGLLDKLKGVGGLTEVLESLRRARRLLARQHEA